MRITDVLFTDRKLRRGPRGASHEKFHAAPSKKQARFLEGPLSLRTQGKSDLLRSHFASKKVLRGTFRGLPPFAPLLETRQFSTNFSCEPHGEGKETCLCPSTDRVRFRLFPSTVWAGGEYGLDWFRVRFRYPLR